MNQCPNCGIMNMDENKFCGECGFKLSSPKNYCPICDKTYSSREKFCTQCGKKLTTKLEHDIIQNDPVLMKINQEFNEMNTTTSSIYDLEGHEVIIILKDGTNLTNWDDVTDKSEVIYIIEDISKYTDLRWKYEHFESLKSIKTLGSTNQLTNISLLFKGCYSLVDISSLVNWDVSNITEMGEMFALCLSLTNLHALKEWDVSNVKEMNRMFSNCMSLNDISPLANWVVSNVEDMIRMFYNCMSLNDISPLANWDVSNVKFTTWMFSRCNSINDISPLENWDVSNVEGADRMFRGCNSIKDFSPIDNWPNHLKEKIMRDFDNL